MAADRIRTLTPVPRRPAAGQPGQRRQGAHRAPEAADRDRAAVRRGGDRAGPPGHGLQLLEAGRRAGAVRATSRRSPRSPSARTPPTSTRIYESLLWAGASVGRSPASPPRRSPRSTSRCGTSRPVARACPLAKLLGAHRDSCRVYNTSGGFLQASVEEIKEKATASLEAGIGGIKIKVGQPDWAEDLRRVAALREHLGDTPFMVDANQQWDRARARRMCRELEAFDLVWIEEPLDAWDAVGHADLSRTFDTPIATGEMLTSVPEHMALIDAGYRGIVQPDAPRIGGITPFLRFATLASHAGLALAPHYAMEIHLHLAAAYPTEPWVEHFEWLNPLFEERIEIHDGRMWVPDRPGLGFTLSERMRSLTRGDRYLRRQ